MASKSVIIVKCSQQSHNLNVRGNQKGLFNLSQACIVRAVVSGGAGGALALPEFGSSLNPIPARGGRLCPPHYW